MSPFDAMLVPTAQPVTEKQAQERHHASGDAKKSFLADEQTMPPQFADKYQERQYLKHRLALAFRIFAQHDLAEGVAGHITVRDPVEPESFWVNPFGMHFSLIRDQDLIRVDKDGKVVDGGKNRRLNQTAYSLHHEVHEARPDVLCAAHAHGLYGRAMCATGRPLLMLTQDFCTFYASHAVHRNFGGLVLTTEEGCRVAGLLGPTDKAVLLCNHGLLTVGRSIEAAVFYFVLLERLCRVQLVAEASCAATGTPLLTIEDKEARATSDAVGTEEVGYFQGLTLFQLAEAEFGEKTLFGRGLETLD